MRTAQKGVVHLLPIFFVLALIAAITLVLVSRGIIKNPLTKITKSAVAPTTQYSNPLDKESQYVNPFSSYKNPFDKLK